MLEFSSTDIVQLLADCISGATIAEIYAAATQKNKGSQRISKLLTKLEQEKIIKYCDVAKRYQCLHADTTNVPAELNALEKHRNQSLAALNAEYHQQLTALQHRCTHRWQYQPIAGEGFYCQICNASAPED